MKEYVADLLNIAKEAKCQKCIRMQHELRRVAKLLDDTMLRSKIHPNLYDHDLHYPLGCKPCNTNVRIKEFLKPKI
jgi:hypothetical protein